jgi:hypothetical protein
MDLQRVRSGSDSGSDWIIALTDGDDNSSGVVKANNVVGQLQRTDIGLIIIGVGADVKPEVTFEMCVCTACMYILYVCALEHVHIHIYKAFIFIDTYANIQCI